MAIYNQVQLIKYPVICSSSIFVPFINIIVIVVAPLLSYYSQYSLMVQNKSVGTFSIDICCILIIANVLRIFFWFSTGFADNLLIQSFLVLGMQFVILDLCIKLGYKDKDGVNDEGFWRWNSFKPFVIFTGIFAFVVGIVTTTFILFGVQFYGTVLGLLSLSIESTLGFPQLISNQKNKNVDGLSIFMVVIWFIGDFLKTIYFVVYNQPFQFIMSGAIQLTVDTLLLIQIMAFKDSSDKSYKNVGDQAIQNDNDHQNTIDQSRISYEQDYVKRGYDPSQEVHGI